MRITKGRPQFGLRETWCADSYLAPIIAAWIKRYLEAVTEPGKDYRKGLPCGLPQEYLNKPETESDEEWNECYDRFLDEIREMAWAFDPGEEPCYSGGYHEGTEHGKETVRPSGAKTYRWDMKPNDPDAWEQSLIDRREWHERRQRGFDLFAKRFNNLWW